MAITDRTICVWIRSMHLTTPLFSLVVLFFGGPVMVTCVLLTSMITGVLYIRNRGCFLSHYEQRVFNDDLFGIDIVLELFDLDKSDGNRFIAAAVLALCFYVVAFIMIYIRFLRLPAVDTLVLLP